MSADRIDIDHLRRWTGSTEVRSDTPAPFSANALAATLDRDGPAFTAGDALPPLWHWLSHLPVFPLSQANYDGHAALGDFLPPVPLPRRMWAGGRLTFHAPVRLGREITKTSEVLEVSHKSGRSGDLVFVTVRHRLHDAGTLCIEEAHDIVYRPQPAPGAPSAPVQPAPEGRFSRLLRPDPVLLFRYSALTFNGHRIHYDRSFCTETEGYPGLVVHGPLLATLLLDLLHRTLPEATVAAFRFRARAPVFDTHPFELHGEDADDAGRMRLWVRRHDRALAMEATAELR